MTFNTIPAFIAEFLFTFALCFVVLNVATKHPPKLKETLSLAGQLVLPFL